MAELIGIQEAKAFPDEEEATEEPGWNELQDDPRGLGAASPLPAGEGLSPEQARPRAPPLHRNPASRSYEKREQRRQRGLEHSQRECRRAASITKEQPDSTVKGQEAARAERPDSTVKGQEAARAERPDQYTFGTADALRRAPVRPCPLPLETPSSTADRNGDGEPCSPTGTGSLQRHVRPGGKKEKADKGKGKRGEGQPDISTIQLPRSESAGSDRTGTVPNKETPVDAQTDGAKLSIQKRSSHGYSNPPDTCLLPPTTPDRAAGFLRKILKKKKEAQTPDDGEQNERGGEAPPPPLLSRPHTEAPGGSLGPSPSIKISRATRVSEQWNASLDREITNVNELRHLDEFLGNQVNDLRSRGKKLSGTEDIFITATMQFRENIKSMYSLSNPHTGYKGLMRSYQNKVISLAGEKQKTEVQLVVNLFQSVLDGFIRGEIKKDLSAEPTKPAKARRKRRSKDKNLENPLDHVFSNYQVNIVQSCDQCNSYIWGMEKAYMCSYCKVVCHKKCLSKIVTDCSSYCAKKNEEESGLHFGVRVGLLTSDKNPVPDVLEIMLEHVEMNGLYTEGIYRKSGSANRMKELHQQLEMDPHSVCLEDVPIHTVTGLVKQWLRELPDPLMTFIHYNDFLRAVELPEKQEQLQAIYKVLEQLPTANFNTLERLIFHLVRVSKEEAHNRMSPNSLAIVFAPCILRCPDTADPLTSMKDVAKTTTCVEMLINEQIKRYNEKMEEIEQLEFAETLAVNQLKLKRQNTHWHLPLRFSSSYRGVAIREKESGDLSPAPEEEKCDSDLEGENMLMERIKSIKQEKEDLACRLPELEQPGSDQDNLDSEASLSSECQPDECPPLSDTEGQY